MRCWTLWVWVAGWVGGWVGGWLTYYERCDSCHECFHGGQGREELALGRLGDGEGEEGAHVGVGSLFVWSGWVGGWVGRLSFVSLGGWVGGRLT